MTSAAQNITELLSGHKWNGTTISYSFLAEYAPYTPPGYIESGGPILLSDAQKNATRALFAHIQSFLGVQFIEVPQNNSQNQIGDIAIGMRSNISLPEVALTNQVLGPGDGGDIWLRSGSFGNGLASQGFVETMLHEIGHALGLKHPTGDIPKTGRYTAEAYDSGGLGVLPTTLQLYDISALQHLYGAATDRNGGDTNYAYGSTNVIESIWDTGGRDTLSASASSTGVVLNLNPTSFSSIGFAPTYTVDNPAKNISIAKGTDIEDAIGSNQADVIIGSGLANKLEGRDGNDVIFGDEVAARAVISDTGSTVLRDWFFDDDFLKVYQYQTAGTSSDTDNDTIEGGAGDDWAFAGRGNDVLKGDAGRDKLDGGTGVDQFFGGRDGDTYTGGAGADEFRVGPQDRVTDSAADDKLFLNGTQVTATGYLATFTEFDPFPDPGFRHGYNQFPIGDRISGIATKHIFINTGSTLFVFFGDGQVAALQNYQQGDFGLSIPDPGAFLTRAKENFDAGFFPTFNHRNLVTEVYTKLLAEAFRLEGLLASDQPLEASAAVREYVTKILQILRPGQSVGYDPATEGVGPPQAPLQAPLLVASSAAPQMAMASIVVGGTSASEFLQGTADNDTISGGAGADILYGMAGSDTYVYRKNDSSDAIIDIGNSGDADVLWLDDLNPNQITIYGDGADLIVLDRARTVIESTTEAVSSMFVLGQFAGDGSGVEQIRFADGTVWDRAQIASAAIHAPTGGTISGSLVEENAPAGRFVGWVDGTDPDFNARFTYSLIDNAQGRFVIESISGSGKLSVAAGAVIDYETATSHNVTVRITDQTGLTFDKSFTITVTDVVGLVGTANDFNGDGMSDILLRHDSSRIATWEIDGSQIIGAADFGAVNSSWTIAGTGYFNDDDTSDILWRNSDGRTAIWEVDGDQIIGAPISAS